MAYTQKNSPFRQTKEAANAVNDQQNKEEVTIPKKQVTNQKPEVPNKSRNRKMTDEDPSFIPPPPKKPQEPTPPKSRKDLGDWGPEPRKKVTPKGEPIKPNYKKKK